MHTQSTSHPAPPHSGQNPSEDPCAWMRRGRVRCCARGSHSGSISPRGLTRPRRERQRLWTEHAITAHRALLDATRRELCAEHLADEGARGRRAVRVEVGRDLLTADEERSARVRVRAERGPLRWRQRVVRDVLAADEPVDEVVVAEVDARRAARSGLTRARRRVARAIAPTAARSVEPGAALGVPGVIVVDDHLDGTRATIPARPDVPGQQTTPRSPARLEAATDERGVAPSTTRSD